MSGVSLTIPLTQPLLLCRSVLALHGFLCLGVVAGCEVDPLRLAKGVIGIPYAVKLARMRRPDLIGDSLEGFQNPEKLAREWCLTDLDLLTASWWCA